MRLDQSPDTQGFIPGLMGSLNEKMQLSPALRPGPAQAPSACRKTLSWPQFPHLLSGNQVDLSDCDHQMKEPARALLENKGTVVSAFIGPEMSLAHSRSPMNNYCVIRGLVKIPSHSVTGRKLPPDISHANSSSTEELIILRFSPFPRATAVTSRCAAETCSSVTAALLVPAQAFGVTRKTLM